MIRQAENKAHIPKEIEFKTKPQIALFQIPAVHAGGVALITACRPIILRLPHRESQAEGFTVG